MYVTRPLSLYLKDELALTLPPPEHNSGYLVISDAESKRLLRLQSGDQRMKRLPFFQNDDFIVDSFADAVSRRVLFIPVLNRPLSDNRYYVIGRDGLDKNLAATSLREGELDKCCGGFFMDHFPSRPLNPFNSYQQFEIIQKPRDRFQAKSMAPDGVPPLYLSEPWKACISLSSYIHPSRKASGLNSSLRAQLPRFNFSSSHDHPEPVIVGKWYCPFMFVRDDKGKKTTFYEMTLEQKWVRFFSKENDNSTGEKGVHVEVDVQTRVAKISGEKDVVRQKRDEASRFVCFIGYDRHRREEVVGLSEVIMERIKWEEESVGWVGGTNGNEKLVRVEEFEGSGTWRKFSCYLLVESFVLKRKDNSCVISFDFNHTHQVRCKWE